MQVKQWHCPRNLSGILSRPMPVNFEFTKAFFIGTAYRARRGYRINFDGSFLPNGVYIYRMIKDGGVQREKCMIAH